MLSSALVGLILCVVPWTSLWETNYLLQPHPMLRMLLLEPAVRGAVSGLGLVNLVLAVDEMRHFLGARR